MLWKEMPAPTPSGLEGKLLYILQVIGNGRQLDSHAEQRPLSPWTKLSRFVLAEGARHTTVT